MHHHRRACDSAGARQTPHTNCPASDLHEQGDDEARPAYASLALHPHLAMVDWNADSWSERCTHGQNAYRSAHQLPVWRRVRRFHNRVAVRFGHCWRDIRPRLDCEFCYLARRGRHRGMRLNSTSRIYAARRYRPFWKCARNTTALHAYAWSQSTSPTSNTCCRRRRRN